VTLCRADWVIEECPSVSGAGATIDVMPNPAELLADLVGPFTVEHAEEVVSTRMHSLVDGAGDLEFWEAHRCAVGYLEEIELAIRGMEEMGEGVAHWRSQFNTWHSFVFAVQANWHATPSGGVSLDPTSYALLRALAQYLDATNYAPDESQAELVELQQTIAEAKALVVEVGLPADAARYVLSLLREAEDVIVNYDLYGSVRLRAATLKLGGAMLMTSGEEVVTRDPAKGKRFRQLAGKIMMGVAIGVGTQVGTTEMQELFGLDPEPLAIEAPAQKQIEAVPTDVVDG
jgi:hypothetical protein